MKKINYKLSIENPCKENWTSMAKSGNGRFCSNCLKNVIDLSILTDNQIIHLLENSNNKICGRLNKDQVDRIMEIQIQQTFETKINKIITGFLLFTSINNLFAQSPIKINETILKTEHLENENIFDSKIAVKTAPKDSLKNLIKGKIFDSETNEPLFGAIVKIKGKDIGTSTNMNGVYTLNIPDNLVDEQVILNVLFIGYEPNEFTINKRDLPIEHKLFMLASKQSLTGEVCVTVIKRKWWQLRKKRS